MFHFHTFNYIQKVNKFDRVRGRHDFNNCILNLELHFDELCRGIDTLKGSGIT